MGNHRSEDFFYPGNAVHGEPDYGVAKTLNIFKNRILIMKRRFVITLFYSLLY